MGEPEVREQESVRSGATPAIHAAASAGAGESPGLRAPLLFLTVFVIATCGLIYELVAGTLSSYLLGDSVTQFSTVIGVYLSAMGLGSYLSKYIQKGLAHRFVDIELAVALVGGFSAPCLFLVFATSHAHFLPVLYGSVIVIGTLVGLEIPLLLRLLRHEFSFKDLVAQVLTFDYVGALVASLLFPLILMPKLGLVRTSLLFGLLNAAVGLWSTWLLKSQLGAVGLLRARACLVLFLLSLGLIKADLFTDWMEHELYAGEILYTKTSPYQRIVVTRDHRAFQLYLNGNLQFNSNDEYRYHEALVHPAMSVRPQARRVLVAGGGDGLALRELLRYSEIEHITLVDLDPAMTQLGKDFTPLRALNGNAFQDPRVEVINDDAMIWLMDADSAMQPYDAAIIDFPDPNNFALGKLYTTRFYALLQKRLTPDAVVVVQSTSPLFARQSFWCIAQTMEAAGYGILPYHLSVPSFGVWGYVMGSRTALSIPTRVPDGLRFLNSETLQSMFVFSRDMERIPSEINRLNNQVLVQYYDEEWKRLF